MSSRAVVQVVAGRRVSGRSAMLNVTRCVGIPELQQLDPFLLFDEWQQDADKPSAGFADHPHRGFETCSIVMKGELEHSDIVSGSITVQPGGVQWMTAGRGVIHSEVPKSCDTGFRSFQSWINLPRKDKMCSPRFQHFQAKDIPTVHPHVNCHKVEVRVIAGECYGVRGPVDMMHPCLLLEVHLQAGATFEQDVPENWNCMAYVFEGDVQVGSTTGHTQQALVMGPGSNVSINSNTGGSFLLLAGQPIDEPVIRHWPFVMTSHVEVLQAFEDYQAGRFMPMPEQDKATGSTT